MRPASAAVFASMLALVVWIAIEFVPIGYNPTDDGFIIGQAARILRGDLPHADLISPRPLGSAFLHVFDLLLPLPLMEATRLVFAVQMAAVTVLFGVVVLRRTPAAWHPIEVVGVAASAIANIHTFPLMPWHTSDGLLMCAAGFTALDRALDRRSTRLLVGAFLFLGAAPVMKQGFFPAPVLGFAWLVWAHRAELRTRPTLLTFARAVAAGSAPLVVYLALVAAGGGVDDALTQLTSSARFTEIPFLALRDEPWRGQLLAAAAVVVVAMLAGRAAEAAGGRRPLVAAAFVVRVVAGVAVVRELLRLDLALWGQWGSIVMALTVVVLVAEAVLWFRIDGRLVLLLATAGMIAVSWGYPFPNLLGGTLAFAAVHRVLTLTTATDGAVRWRRWQVGVVTSLAAIASIALITTFDASRRSMVYFDRPESELTARLSAVDADFGRLRATPVTRQYLDDIARCVKEHPAPRVAVLPDNPGLYPILELESPLPMEWLYPPEYVGTEERLLDATRDLVREGSYLVMFQTFSAFGLRDFDTYPMTEAAAQPFVHNDPTLAQIATILEEATPRMQCGSLIAFYEPASARTG